VSDKFTLSVIIKAIDHLTAPMKKMVGQLGLTSKKLKSMGTATRQFGRDMATRVSLPIVAGLTGVAAAAISWEDAFASVAKTVKATPEELSALALELRQLSKEIPVGANELAAFAASAGQLDIATPNILDFVRVVAEMGEATNLAGEEGASQMAKFANNMLMSQKDFRRLASTIVELGNTGASTEAEIMKLAMRLAPAGRVMGLTSANVVALAATLADLGEEAESGGTAYSQVMYRMSKLSGAVTKKQKREVKVMAAVIGLSVSEFQKLFKKDKLAMVVRFVEGLERLQKAGGNVAQALDFMGMEGARIQQSLIRTAGRTEKLTDKLKQAAEAWAKGTALTVEANRKFNTTKARLGILKGTLMDTARVWGSELLPVIDRTTEKLKPLIESMAEFDSATKKAAMGSAAITATVSPLIFAAGVLFALMGAPGLILVGLIALIPVVSYLLIKHWSKIGDFLEELGRSFERFWDRFDAMIVSGILKVLEGVDMMVNALPKWVQLGMMIDEGDLKALKNWIGAFNEKQKTIMEEIWSSEMDSRLAAGMFTRPARGIPNIPTASPSIFQTAPIATQQTEILLKLIAEEGTSAKVEQVRGPGGVTVYNQAYVGAH